jgi:hypothetical protein
MDEIFLPFDFTALARRWSAPSLMATPTYRDDTLKITFGKYSYSPHSPLDCLQFHEWLLSGSEAPLPPIGKVGLPPNLAVARSRPQGPVRGNTDP